MNKCRLCLTSMEGNYNDIEGEFCDRCFEEVLDNSLSDPYAEIVKEAQRLTIHND